MKYLLSIFFLLISLLLQAQDLKLKSFTAVGNDLSARTQKVYDANGVPCALVKVGLAMEGAEFFGDLLKVVPMVSEYWVYLTEGATYMDVRVPGYLPFMYKFPKPLEKLTTYRLTIVSPQGATPSSRQTQQQGELLVVTSNPEGSEVYLDGELEGITPLSKRFPRNSIVKYRVSRPFYNTVSGEIIVDNTPKELKVELTRGTFADVIVRTYPAVRINIDGEDRGKGSVQLSLSEGSHQIEVSAEGYVSAKQTYEFKAGEQREIKLYPTPKYGKLYVQSNPDDAEVLIDGLSFGRTPNILNNVLEGQHTVTIVKKGYKQQSSKLTIVENKLINLKCQLQKGGDPMEFNVNGVAFKMLHVQGGTFIMGAQSNYDKDPEDNEQPLHKVTLSDFFIGETEVTQELWEAVMNTNPSHFKGRNLPVESVSWEDCQEFCRKLSSITGKQFCLPTEAQWEYAAKSRKGRDANKFSGSKDIDAVAWYEDNAQSTKDVASKLPNDLGIYDMSGNVWEWCQDLYGDYTTNSQENPTGIADGQNNVYRGGGWMSNRKNCRITKRACAAPAYSNVYLGFRLAMKQ